MIVKRLVFISFNKDLYDLHTHRGAGLNDPPEIKIKLRATELNQPGSRSLHDII